MTKRFPGTFRSRAEPCASTTRCCSALLIVLLAACDADAASVPDAALATSDGALTNMDEMGDAQAIDYFPTKPLCASEVAYPPVSGDGICALEVPALDGSSPDFATMNLVLRVGGARIMLFDHVVDSEACERLQAWHYDDVSKPAQLVLCPEACSLAGSDPDSQVQLLTGCDIRCARTDTGCAPATP